MRALKISTLAIQTAGYSGQAVKEIRIEGMEHTEDFRELIRSLVRQPAVNGNGAGGAATLVRTVPHATDQKILEELIRIRLLLEVQRI